MINRNEIKSLIDSVNILNADSTQLAICMAKSKANRLFGNKDLSIQVSSSDSLSQANQEATSNNLSQVDLTECLNKLRAYYNLTKDDQFSIVKTDISTDIDNSDSSAGAKKVKLAIYSLKDYQKLNITVCTDNSIVVKFPLRNNTSFNSEKYAAYKNQSVDIYNPLDRIFTSRCYPFAINGYDTTINFRRRLIYANHTMSCDKCTYNGIGEDNLVQCDCSGISDEDVLTPELVTYALDLFDSLNIDIIKCIELAFNVYIFIILESSHSPKSWILLHVCILLNIYG
jgi:hypothetical protein